LTAGEAVLQEAFLVDVPVGVDRVWQVALGLFDQVLSACLGKDGEYLLLECVSRELLAPRRSCGFLQDSYTDRSRAAK
jgi:hypothetical protein